MLTVDEIQVLIFVEPQVTQAPDDKYNPDLHPIAFPVSADEHPSTLVASAQAVQTPPVKKYPATHEVATGDNPVAAPFYNGIHYDIAEFSLYPVKQEMAIVKGLETEVGAEHEAYPTLHGTGTPETK